MTPRVAWPGHDDRNRLHLQLTCLVRQERRGARLVPRRAERLSGCSVGSKPKVTSRRGGAMRGPIPSAGNAEAVPRSPGTPGVACVARLAAATLGLLGALEQGWSLLGAAGGRKLPAEAAVRRYTRPDGEGAAQQHPVQGCTSNARCRGRRDGRSGARRTAGKEQGPSAWPCPCANPPFPRLAGAARERLARCFGLISTAFKWECPVPPP